MQNSPLSRLTFFSYVWRYSKREQIAVLLLILASLPFYWASLDLPKRIVSDAIQGKAFAGGAHEIEVFRSTVTLPEFLGGGAFPVFDGVMLGQFHYLLALSFLFLFFTLLNGAFKFVINIQKGVLGERMLRRLRFQLFSMVMRFRPEDIKATKSAEIASLLKDEVEPIGGFFGEAIITPVFLSMQAITALLFIMVQNVLLGAMAGAVIAIQGLIIPKLRREQLRLGRARQLASRKLAGRVSEMVDAAPMLHNHALVPFVSSEIGDRLAQLFDIRYRLFRRKFSVKYLNNLLAQVTPFIFYTFGGYLALNGQLDIGQLVAVIAAYRDLPTPIKELIDWDQQRSDVEIKFQQVVAAFSRDLVPMAGAKQDEVAADAPIRFSGLKVVSTRGVVQLELPNLVLNRPAHVALVGPQGSGRDFLLKVIGRQITDFSGTVTLGDMPVEMLTDKNASRNILYVGSDPYVMSGSIFDNICLSARLKPPTPHGEGENKNEASLRERAEAERTGNPVHAGNTDWTDYQLLGVEGQSQLDMAVIDALRAVHGYDSVFQTGMSGRLGFNVDEDIRARIIAARNAITDALVAKGVNNLVEPFDAAHYHLLSTIGENLLFGVAVGKHFQPDVIAKEPYFRAILEAESLTEPLTRVGLKILELANDVLKAVPANSPLYERYSFIDPSELESLGELLRMVRRQGKSGMPETVRERLISSALQYKEAQHRLGVLDDILKARILRARRSFRKFLSARQAREIEFYDHNLVMGSAPIKDNVLFGRVVSGVSGSRRKVNDVVNAILHEHGLEPFVIRQGLEQEAGPSGRLLASDQRAMIPLARCLITKPAMVVLDNALAGFSATQQPDIVAAMRKALAGRSLVVTFDDEQQATGFDRVLIFSGSRIVEDRDLNTPSLEQRIEPEVAEPQALIA